MNLNKENKNILEKVLGIKITLRQPVNVFRGKYRLEISDDRYFVSHSALTPNRALEKTLNLWIQYDRHTPYVDVDYLVAMIKNLPENYETESILSKIITEDGEMNGLFTKIDGRYKLYSFHKAVKQNKI
ncbi:MAG TPA: hypothetical protein VKA34_04000 [Balneolales bacterium]|nr:hypothetical protein [Balneolales bacterium]